MDRTSSYSELLTAKNGSQVPARQNISFHSKYNPEKENESFPLQFSPDSKFFVILGICGGYHIASLIRHFPDAKIIAAEQSEKDIEFLKQIECVQELSKNENIVFTTISDLKSVLSSEYLPALYGNICIAPLRQWAQTFPELYENALNEINSALKEIAVDFSTQKHFGKLWQKNILLNLSFADKTVSFENVIKQIDVKNKTAAIIAAGPSLDSAIPRLIADRNSYCIISTDTAYSALLKHGIISDFVLTVDAQMISHAHYMDKISNETTFLFDLSVSNSTVRKILKAGANLAFFESGHPLARLASTYNGKKYFEFLDSGSGTVTLAAANFAVKAGFNRLEFFGADFSYIKGQAYTKGTYLDALYRKDEDRINNSSTAFSKLMFRTELIKLNDEVFTTEILNSYKKSFEAFLYRNNLKKEAENIYTNKNNENNCMNAAQSSDKFDFTDFKFFYEKKLNELFDTENDKENDRAFSYSAARKSPFLMTLLPFCASLGENSAFLAYTKTLEYTKKI